jgi:hypothetical protein
VLERVGVQLDEAVNGVFLPAARQATEQAMNHLTLHTNRYYAAVNDALVNVATREQAVEALGAIKQALLNGTFVK